MNISDAERIITLEYRVEELETKIALLEKHTKIDYDKTLEKMKDDNEEGVKVEKKKK